MKTMTKKHLKGGNLYLYIRDYSVAINAKNKIRELVDPRHAFALSLLVSGESRSEKKVAKLVDAEGAPLRTFNLKKRRRKRLLLLHQMSLRSHQHHGLVHLMVHFDFLYEAKKKKDKKK